MHIHTPFVAHYAGVRFARRANIACIATGAPVVSTAELGTRSILLPGCGALIVPERRDAFAAAVVRVLTETGLRAELAARGRAYARNWSSAEMARRLAELYSEVRTARRAARAGVSPQVLL